MTTEESGHVHDWSFVKASQDAQNEALTSPGRADLLRMTGWAGLGVGVGIGAAAFGLSFLWKPQIDVKWSGDRIVLNGEVVGPHLTGATGERGERGPAGERGKDGVTLPAPMPKVGEKATPEQFTKSREFSEAPFSGRVVSLKGGTLTFDNGHIMQFMQPDGKPDAATTTSRFDGDLAYCATIGGKFPDGSTRWACQALHDGVISPMLADTPRSDTSKGGK